MHELISYLYRGLKPKYDLDIIEKVGDGNTATMGSLSRKIRRFIFDNVALKDFKKVLASFGWPPYSTSRYCLF